MGKSRRPGRRTSSDGRSLGDTKHVRLHKWLLNGAAYRSLSCYARATLVELYDLYNGSNNGEMFLSVREAARRIGTSARTAMKALDQLKERGFIRPHRAGAFSVKFKYATSWILTEFSFAGELPEKTFMSWRSSSKKQNTVASRATPCTTTCNTESADAWVALCSTMSNTGINLDGSTTCNTGSLPAGGGDLAGSAAPPRVIRAALPSPTAPSIARAATRGVR